MSSWKIALGVVCIIAGLIGMVLPLAPGLIFVLIGLELVGLGYYIPDSIRERGREYMKNIKKRFKGSKQKSARKRTKS